MFWWDYLRSRSFDNVRVSGVIYLMIWLVGLIVTFSSVVFLRDQGRLGLDGGLSGLLLAFLSVIILSLTYIDMEEIEHLRGKEHDYPGWIGKWLEVVLRMVIVACLLLSVGEFHTLVQITVAGWNGVLDIGRAVYSLLICGSNVSDAPAIGVFKHALPFAEESIFVIGSAGTFFFICAWNTCAIVCRVKEHKNRYPSVREKGDPALCAKYHLVFARIVIYMIIGLISCLYWIFVSVRAPWIDTFAKVFIVLYFFLIMVAVLFRVSRVRGRFESWLGGLFNTQ